MSVLMAVVLARASMLVGCSDVYIDFGREGQGGEGSEGNYELLKAIRWESASQPRRG